MPDLEKLRRAVSYDPDNGQFHWLETRGQGRKGVTKHHDGRWRAKISVSGKTIHLGLFESVDSAHESYISAAQKYFGEFARGA